MTHLPFVEEAQSPPTWSLGEFQLRPLRASDAAALYSYVSDPRVIEHTSIPELDLASVQASVARHLDGYASKTSCRWALVDSADVLVGTCGFSNWSLPHSHAELVYDLAPAFWHRGLMRAAVRQVLDWAFNRAGFNRVHAFVMVSNIPSIRLLESVGFSPEGTLRQFRFARGVARDFHSYAMLRAETRTKIGSTPNPSLQRAPPG